MSAYESSGKSDEWYTPKYIFDALGCTFDMDVAAPVDRTHVHTPTNRFITQDSLENDWNGFLWMNPPFGKRNGLEPWLDKFFNHGNGIALTPDRTSAPWFFDAWLKADLVLFTRKIKFYDAKNKKVGKSPGTGTALFGSGEKAVNALVRASKAGLGILGVPMNYRTSND